MSPPIAELEKQLATLVTEHRTLLAAVQRHLDAMRTCDAPAIAAAADAIEAARGRIVFAEAKRRQQMAQVVRTHGFSADASLVQVAEAVPAHRLSLLRVRQELKAAMQEVAGKTTVSGRVAHAMLGHLNTVVRLIAGAMHTAAVYTRSGAPTVGGRVGMIEAVG